MTKFPIGQKPPIVAPIRGQYTSGGGCVNTIEIKCTESKVDIYRLISPSEARRNDQAKRGSKQLGFEGAVSPQMGPGAKPRKILIFQASRRPKINNSNTKSYCSVSSRVRLLRTFCLTIPMTN